MDVGLIVALVVLPGVMLLAAVLSQAAATGRLTRNHLVGIRLPSTMASDEAWVAGHRAAVRPCWVLTACFVVADAVVLVLAGRGVPDPDLAAGSVLLLLPAIVVIAVAATRGARRAG